MILVFAASVTCGFSLALLHIESMQNFGLVKHRRVSERKRGLARKPIILFNWKSLAIENDPAVLAANIQPPQCIITLKEAGFLNGFPWENIDYVNRLSEHKIMFRQFYVRLPLCLICPGGVRDGPR